MADAADASAGQGQSPNAGVFVDQCSIDLPPNDVVESIEFERFFVIEARLQELQRPVTLLSAALSERSEDWSEDELATVPPELLGGAPLSNKRHEWNLRDRAVALQDPDRGDANVDDLPTARDALRDRLKALRDARKIDTSVEPLLHESAPGGGGDRNATNEEPEVARFAASAGSGADVVGPKALPNLDVMKLAFYLPYRQEWKLNGYYQGRVVNSFTLLPDEEQVVEIFKWDRLSTTMDSSTTFELDQTSESSSSRRDTLDISNDVARQAGFELTSTAKVGFKVGVVNADFGGGTDAKTSLNAADKDARQTITDATSKAATHVRSSRTLKVVETRESGEETRTTRTLRNRNTCHTLTAVFHEVLAGYTVSTELLTAGIRLVVLVPSAGLSDITHFDRSFVRSHERALTLALLDSTLTPGFEAARFLDARDRACSVLCTGCHCEIDLRVPPSNSEWEALKTALIALGRAVDTARVGTSIGSFIRAWVTDPTSPIAPIQAAIRRRLFLKSVARSAPRLLTQLGALNLSSGAITTSTAAAAVEIIAALDPDTLHNLEVPDEMVQTEMFFEIVGALTTIGVDPGSALITAGTISGVIGGLGTHDDGGVFAAMGPIADKYAAWQARVAEDVKNDKAQAELLRIAADERAIRLLDAFPLRASADAGERLDALLAHLNDERNIDHYRFAVWNERAGSNDTILLQLALAGLTEGAPVGVVGDSLAIALRIPDGSGIQAFFNASIADLVAMSPRDDDPHLLPTAALYAEAVVGECCACEDALVERETMELHRLGLDNDLIEVERDRRRAKLAQATPDLSGAETVQPLRVEIVGAGLANSTA